MKSKISLHPHANERLIERFNKDRFWLINELENGRFVWLKGYGNSLNDKKVRNGYLLYIPDQDQYCIAVIDNRSKIVITILTEEMTLFSSWAKGLNAKEKLKAKRIALGEEIINDTFFLKLYAEERETLNVNVCIKTFSIDWEPITKNLCKINVLPDQINTSKKTCALTKKQLEVVLIIINERVSNKEIRPYGEVFISTAQNKRALISNPIESLNTLDEAELDRRWL